MAEERGLELDLSLNISEFEAALMKVDADTQKIMRKMHSELKSDNLKFDIQISGAKAAGNEVKAYQLELAKLTHTYKAQEATVNALRKRLDELNKSEEKNESLIKQVNGLLDKETLKLNKMKIQLNNLNSGFSEKLLSGLSKISPTIGNAIQNLKTFRTELEKVGAFANAGVFAKAVSVAAVPLLTGIGAYKIFSSLTEDVKNFGNEAGKANEPIYQLREEIGETYENAEKLHGVMALDGISGDTFAQTMNKLNKSLLNAGESGNLASDMLRRWNVELRDGNDNRKNMIDQLKALADGYQRAQKAGEGKDFLTATGTRPLVHILSDLDGYIERWDKLHVKMQKNYDMSHLLMEMDNHMAEAQRELAAARGEAFTDDAVKIKEAEIKAVVAETVSLQQNEKIWKEYSKTLGEAAITFTNTTLTAKIFFRNLVLGVANAGNAFKNSNIVKYLTAISDAMLKLPAFIVPKKLADFIGTAVKDASNEAQKALKEAEKVKIEPKQQEPIDVNKEREAKKKEEADIKRREEALARIKKQLRDINASDYEKQINRLKDEVQANIDAGVDISKAWELYYAQKDKLDQKQYEEQKKRLEEETRKQQELIKKRQDAENAISQVFMTETEKRIQAIKKQRDEWIKAGADEVRATKAAQKEINEARMSEAERAVQDYKKLADFITKAQKQGKFSESAVTDYAKRLQYERSGFTANDVKNVASVGIEELRKLMETARQSILQPLTGTLPMVTDNTLRNVSGDTGKQITVNSPITVNFDNVVTEDVTSMQKIADKVAGVIQPAIERALRGETYGY